MREIKVRRARAVVGTHAGAGSVRPSLHAFQFVGALQQTSHGSPQSSGVVCRHSVKVTRKQAWDRILSRSYLAILPAEEQNKVKAQFQSVLDDNKDKFHAPEGSNSSDVDSEVAEIPLRLEVFIARKC